MSTPISQLVHLAADSPLGSMHARPLTFIEAKCMGKRPERRKEGGATFGTFQFLCGSKTGWLYMPHPGLLDDVARVQYFKELQEAKPGYLPTCTYSRRRYLASSEAAAVKNCARPCTMLVVPAAAPTRPLLVRAAPPAGDERCHLHACCAARSMPRRRSSR